MKHAAGFMILLALSLSVYGCDTDSQMERAVNSSHGRATEPSISATESLLYDGQVRYIGTMDDYKKNPEKYPGELVQLDADPKFAVLMLKLSVAHKRTGPDINDDYRVYAVADTQRVFGLPVDKLEEMRFRIQEHELQRGKSGLRDITAVSIEAQFKKK